MKTGFVYSSLHLFHFVLSGKETIDVASHVLQFVFLGNNGFRFPFAHFPTKEADPASLYTNFWKAVGWLRGLGFRQTSAVVMAVKLTGAL